MPIALAIRLGMLLPLVAAAGPPLDLMPHSGDATGAPGSTRCAACHTTDAWQHAAFNHDRTGFALQGAHAKADCKECHGEDLKLPVSRSCAGCHQDPHRGELGQQCQGCHTVANWTPLFNAEAHRRTNFPLVGRHAFIPCSECHIAMTNRSFERTAVNCAGCHMADYNSTASTQVNHQLLNFGTNCGACHTGVTWFGAKYAAHDSCFEIIGGPHAALQCLSCHTAGLQGAVASGSCGSASFACSSCHAHVCSAMDSLHQAKGVPGYQCKDQKCYACHRITSSP